MTNTQLTNDLEVLEKLAVEATAGPWEVNPLYTRDFGMSRYVESDSRTICNTGSETNDVEFIAAARNFLTPANIATLKALLAGGRWLPIESAPKDGSRFLAYWPYWSNEPFVAHYCGSSGGWEGERCVSPTHADAFPERQPTHWMALPAPPSTESP